MHACVRVCLCARACVYVSILRGGGGGAIIDNKFVYVNILF